MKTDQKITILKAATVLCPIAYYALDQAPYARRNTMTVGFVAYMIVYFLVKKLFHFQDAISYKRVMSLMSSTLVSSLAAYALFFEEDSKGHSLIDGYQSLFSGLAINLEIGMYVADLLTITKDQFAIPSLLVHHVLGVAFFSYASLRGISSLMICYALLQEACNPFWYAHMLLYRFDAYVKKDYQLVFFVNAFMTWATYIVIRFLMVKPNAIVSTYEICATAPNCNWFDCLYAIVCAVSLIGVNLFNIVKLTQSIIKAAARARGEKVESVSKSKAEKKNKAQ